VAGDDSEAKSSVCALQLDVNLYPGDASIIFTALHIDFSENPVPRLRKML